MPFSSRKKALVRGDLGVAVDEYRKSPASFGWIAEKILRPIIVPMQSSEFPVIPIEAMLSSQDTKRAMRGFYNRSDYEVEMGFYATKENGWEELIDERELKLYRNLFDAELIAVNRALGIILRSQEMRVAKKLFNAANFDGGGLDVEWSTHATATPIDDIGEAVDAVRSKCGMIPDTLILPYNAFKNIRRCKQVSDLLKYTFPGKDINSMTAEQLAQVLDVQRVLVGDEQVNTAKKGKSAVLGEIWDDEYALLTCTAQGDSFDEPCVGRIVRWSEESGDGEGGTIVEQYYVDGNRSDTYRVRNDSDELLLKTYDDAGSVKSDIAKSVSYLFSNVTA
jgi:hypothetical protein